MGEWISVNHSIPKYGQVCIVCTNAGFVQNIAYYRDGADGEPDWWNDCLEDDLCIDWDEISHWMPLPEPPKDE